MGRVQHLHPDSNWRGPVPHAAKSLEFVGPDVLDRGDGDRHGADHRHAPHRSFGWGDPWLRFNDHRRDAGLCPAPLSRHQQPRDLGHHRHPRPHYRRSDRGIERLACRLSRHSVLHRHPRRAIVLARRRVVGDDRTDHRAARRPFRADGRRPARFYRRRGELDSGRACLRRHRRGSLHQEAAAGALCVSSAADVGGGDDRGRRLFCRARRDLGRQCLSMARARGGELCGRSPYRGAPRRPVHLDRLCNSGVDGVGRRCRDDLRGEAHPLRPLRLCGRRQSRGGRTRRRQHQEDHGVGLRFDGRAGGDLGLHRVRRAWIRRPTFSGSSKNFTSSQPRS